MNIILLILIFALGICLWRIYKSKTVLQKQLSVVEYALNKRLDEFERRQQQELTQEQIDYKDKLQAQYAILFRQLEENFKSEIKTVKSDAVGVVQKCKMDFEKLLKEEFQKACDSIQFDEIEYKKTITKKRREFNRKNSHKAKPQKIWRSITDE